ncbi:LCP family protein [Actinocatenispora rupis]|uniref:LCP family protein n=1 Tax=Actinocatenispora rupis TaxID=519421 RepID=UPI0019415EBF|nr:LCP family protein [Actinocatenispora rupis]
MTGPSRTARRRRRRRSPLWARLCIVAGAVLLLGSGGALATGAVLVDHVNNSVHTDDLLGDGSPRRGTADVRGPIDMLLAGSDMRTSWQTSGEKPRTDSIMWLHIPATLDRAYLLSLPRDLRVDIPADGRTGLGGGEDRLNASFPDGMRTVNDIAGGMQQLNRTVSRLTGAHFTMAGLVNWDGFTAITTELGGVTMCLDQGFTSHQPGFTNGPPLTFPKGCHHYDADKALKLVRQRDDVPGGDYGRQKLQQQYVKQILKQATSRGVVSNPTKIDSLLTAAGKAVTLDLGGYKPVDLALALHRITPATIVTLQVPHRAIWSGGTSEADGGTYEGEGLQQPLGDRLFAAMRTDRVDELLLTHPELASTVPG